jgi:formate/nitrite transporter FocA (FNT family)
MEAYLLVLAGDWAWWQMLSQFLLPVLIGNMIGGTARLRFSRMRRSWRRFEDN